MQEAINKVRLLLADDHAEMLEATRSLLSQEFDVVATAVTGVGLVSAAQRLRPDIVVTDIRMPGLNGIDAARKILELRCCKAVVVLSMLNNPEVVKTAFDAGITGYVLKESAGDELIGAIRAAVSGKEFLSAALRSGRRS